MPICTFVLRIGDGMAIRCISQADVAGLCAVHRRLREEPTLPKRRVRRRGEVPRPSRSTGRLGPTYEVPRPSAPTGQHDEVPDAPREPNECS